MMQDELYYLFGKTTTKLGMVGGTMNGKIVKMDKEVIDEITKTTIAWEVIGGKDMMRLGTKRREGECYTRGNDRNKQGNLTWPGDGDD